MPTVTKPKTAPSRIVEELRLDERDLRHAAQMLGIRDASSTLLQIKLTLLRNSYWRQCDAPMAPHLSVEIEAIRKPALALLAKLERLNTDAHFDPLLPHPTITMNAELEIWQGILDIEGLRDRLRQLVQNCDATRLKRVEQTLIGAPAAQARMKAVKAGIRDALTALFDEIASPKYVQRQDKREVFCEWAFARVIQPRAISPAV